LIIDCGIDNVISDFIHSDSGGGDSSATTHRHHNIVVVDVDENENAVTTAMDIIANAYISSYYLRHYLSSIQLQQ
jgi:hypothetical protein